MLCFRGRTQKAFIPWSGLLLPHQDCCSNWFPLLFATAPPNFKKIWPNFTAVMFLLYSDWRKHICWSKWSLMCGSNLFDPDFLAWGLNFGHTIKVRPDQNWAWLIQCWFILMKFPHSGVWYRWEVVCPFWATCPTKPLPAALSAALKHSDMPQLPSLNPRLPTQQLGPNTSSSSSEYWISPLTMSWWATQTKEGGRKDVLGAEWRSFLHPVSQISRSSSWPRDFLLASHLSINNLPCTWMFPL